MLCGHLVAGVSGLPGKMDGIMNSAKYQNILALNLVESCVCVSGQGHG